MNLCSLQPKLYQRLHFVSQGKQIIDFHLNANSLNGTFPPSLLSTQLKSFSLEQTYFKKRPTLPIRLSENLINAKMCYTQENPLSFLSLPHVFTHAPRIPLGLPLVFSSEHELLMRGVIMFPILNLHHIGVSSLFLNPLGCGCSFYFSPVSKLYALVTNIYIFSLARHLASCEIVAAQYTAVRSRTSKMYWKFVEHPGGKRGPCSHCTIKGRGLKKSHVCGGGMLGQRDENWTTGDEASLYYLNE